MEDNIRQWIHALDDGYTAHGTQVSLLVKVFLFAQPAIPDLQTVLDLKIAGLRLASAATSTNDLPTEIKLRGKTYRLERHEDFSLCPMMGFTLVMMKWGDSFTADITRSGPEGLEDLLQRRCVFASPHDSCACMELPPALRAIAAAMRAPRMSDDDVVAALAGAQAALHAARAGRRVAGEAHYKALGLCLVCDQLSRHKCGRCKRVKYCSRDCQAKDWKDHRSVCASAAP